MGRRQRLNGGGDQAGPVAFVDYIGRWRQSPDLAGLELRDVDGQRVGL